MSKLANLPVRPAAERADIDKPVPLSEFVADRRKHIANKLPALSQGWLTQATAQDIVLFREKKEQEVSVMSTGAAALLFCEVTIALLGPSPSVTQAQRDFVLEMCKILDRLRPFPSKQWTHFVKQNIGDPEFVVRALSEYRKRIDGLGEAFRDTRSEVAASLKATDSQKMLLIIGRSRTLAWARKCFPNNDDWTLTTDREESSDGDFEHVARLLAQMEPSHVLFSSSVIAPTPAGLEFVVSRSVADLLGLCEKIGTTIVGVAGDFRAWSAGFYERQRGAIVASGYVTFPCAPVSALITESGFFSPIEYAEQLESTGNVGGVDLDALRARHQSDETTEGVSAEGVSAPALRPIDSATTVLSDCKRKVDRGSRLSQSEVELLYQMKSQPDASQKFSNLNRINVLLKEHYAQELQRIVDKQTTKTPLLAIPGYAQAYARREFADQVSSFDELEQVASKYADRALASTTGFFARLKEKAR